MVSLYAYSQDEKKDLYQEVVLQAWKGWKSFRGEARFSTWLYRICLNTILTQKRKGLVIDYKDSLEPYAENIRSPESFDHHKKSLYWAIRQLPETERAVISMHLDGYDNAEIAATMGISNNNVAVKLHRIKEKLVNLLKPER